MKEKNGFICECANVDCLETFHGNLWEEVYFGDEFRSLAVGNLNKFIIHPDCTYVDPHQVSVIEVVRNGKVIGKIRVK